MITSPIYVAISYFFKNVNNKKEAEQIYNELEDTIKRNEQGIDGLQLDFEHIQDPEKMLRYVEELADVISKRRLEERYEPRHST
ncbi:hypothetical protein FDH01_gp120 [Acinetobacter phage vB_AbaM_ME3]|uniref:Uncharacterized protein n=1 Tax=Acinetobacter phage vB_AbaM_ME3 TaxID=1837876 RepID=A0A172Q095_9CAUD|nr:hypothetical protein FDH01_gp120 [Acinetobacter phage vB_AbaM_ME3]AND75281.1 hypothetical protein ME3_120 [Acinetobacter phage vB_AbaM_ME3]